MDGLLDGDDRVAGRLQLGDGLQRVGDMLPGHAVLGAEGRFVDLGGRRNRADAAQPDLVRLEGVGRTECRSDIVRAADIVKHDDQSGLRETPVFLGTDAAKLYVQ